MDEKSARTKITSWAVLMAIAGVLIGQHLSDWTGGRPDPLGMAFSVALLLVALWQLVRAVRKFHA